MALSPLSFRINLEELRGDTRCYSWKEHVKKRILARTDHFGSVRREYLESPLRMVHCDRFYQSDRNVSSIWQFGFTCRNLGAQAALWFPAHSYNNQTRGTAPADTWNSKISNRNFYWMESTQLHTKLIEIYNQCWNHFESYNFICFPERHGLSSERGNVGEKFSSGDWERVT